MNSISIVQEYINKLMNQEEFYDKKEIYTHLYGVALLCTLLALKRDLDPELATIMGLLHDFSTYNDTYTVDHAVKGKESVKLLLRELNIIDENKIELICNAIGKHSEKNEIDLQYDELLKDADVLHHCLYNYSEIIIDKEIKRFQNLVIEFDLKKTNLFTFEERK